jgi:ParB family transcriptional regulator, chromosome partitioning protein
MQLINVSIEHLQPMQEQPRTTFAAEALDNLKTSIQHTGLLQPLTVAKSQLGDGFVIIAGERRYRALKDLGYTTVPVLVSDAQPEEIPVIALLDNLQREDLTALEEARYLAKLKREHHLTEESLGQKLGKSRDYVHQRIRLVKLPADILAAWEDNSELMTPSQAILLGGHKTLATRKLILEKLAHTPITVAQLRETIKGIEQVQDALELDETIQHNLIKKVLGGQTAKQIDKRIKTIQLLNSVENGFEPSPTKQTPSPVSTAVTTEPEASGDRLLLTELKLFELFQTLTQRQSSHVELDDFQVALAADVATLRAFLAL